MYIGLHVKYRLFLSDFNETLSFYPYLRKILKKSNFLKIRPVGAELFRADGQTERYAAANFVVFRNFAETP
jgi:hypothetical protein